MRDLLRRPPVSSVRPADAACPLSFVSSGPTERSHVSADCVDSGVIPGKTREPAVAHLGAPAARISALAATDGEIGALAQVYVTSITTLITSARDLR